MALVTWILYIAIRSILANEFSVYFTGTYEFEVLGRPMRLYICEALDQSGALHWAVSDVHANEYTFMVARDSDGPTLINTYVYEAECDVFRLYGHEVLAGFWKLQFNRRRHTYELLERFPELEIGEETEYWNTYLVKKISSGIVANPEMEEFQCFAPAISHSIWPIYGKQLWVSNLLEHPHPLFAYQFFEGDGETSCWKFQNPQDAITNGGYNYDFQVEWDGDLLIMRWDDQIAGSITNPCSRGSLFMVRTSYHTAIVTHQCEDIVTGYQYLVMLQNKMNLDDVECPIWEVMNTNHMSNMNMPHMPYMNVTSDEPTSDPTNGPTHQPTPDPVDRPTGDPTAIPTNQPTTDPTTYPTHQPTDDPTTYPTMRPGNNYMAVQRLLETCAPSDWREYMRTFRNNQVTDQILPKLDKEHWNALIPKIGIRLCVKSLMDD